MTNQEAAKDLAEKLHYPEVGMHEKQSIIIAFLDKHDAEVRAKAFRKAKSEWNKWGRSKSDDFGDHLLALAADLAQAPGEEGRNG